VNAYLGIEGEYWMNLLIITPDTPGLASTHLIEYLRSTDHTVTVVRHPVAPSVGRSRMSTISAGGGVRQVNRERHKGLFSYWRDFNFTVDWIDKRDQVFDWAICLSSHLAEAGLLLRRRKKVKKVVYWALDYYPRRYGKNGVTGSRMSALLEWPYRRVEKHVVKNVDVRWTITRNMSDGWKLGGYSWHGPVFTVPHAITLLRKWSEVGEQVPNRLHHSLFWAGALRPEFGFDLVVNSWEELKGRFPNLRLTVSSRTPISRYEEFLKREDVDVVGFIPDEGTFLRLVGSHSAGLAPYQPGSYKTYSDSARVKTYASCGVPILITRHCGSWEEVYRFGAGRIIDNGNLVDAASAILSDATLQRSLADGALSLARMYTADKVFPKALDQLESLHS